MKWLKYKLLNYLSFKAFVSCCSHTTTVYLYTIVTFYKRYASWYNVFNYSHVL